MSVRYISKSIGSLAEETGEAAFMREMDYLLTEKKKLEKSMIRQLGYSVMDGCRKKVWAVAEMEVQERQICTGWKPVVNVLKGGQKVRWHLPVEIWCMVFEELSLDDLKRVRSTSCEMRDLVGPVGRKDTAKMSDAQYVRYVKGRMRDVALSRVQQVEEQRQYNECVRVFKGLYNRKSCRKSKQVDFWGSQYRQPDGEDYEDISGGSVTVTTVELLEECYLQAVWLRSPVRSVFVNGCPCKYCEGQTLHAQRSFMEEFQRDVLGSVVDDGDEEFDSTG
ncbi:hypothetical protein ACMFMG_011769 [Clarireedia jacksonii]